MKNTLETRWKADVDLLLFLERHAQGLLQRDILALVAGNPTHRWSVEEIARSLRRSPAAIQVALQSLVQTGVVEAYPLGGTTYYTLGRDAHLQALAHRLRTYVAPRPRLTTQVT